LVQILALQRKSENPVEFVAAAHDFGAMGASLEAWIFLKLPSSIAICSD
jgi:hypothetical protein